MTYENLRVRMLAAGRSVHRSTNSSGGEWLEDRAFMWWVAMRWRRVARLQGRFVEARGADYHVELDDEGDAMTYPERTKKHRRSTR